MSNEPSRLAIRINELRRAKGLSKAELGRRVGVTDVSVRYWETGEIQRIGHTYLLGLANAFEMTVSELIEDPREHPLKVDTSDDVQKLLETATDPMTWREGHKLVDLGPGLPHALVDFKVRLIDEDDVSVNLNGTCNSADDIAERLDMPEEVILKLAQDAEIEQCTTCSWWFHLEELELVEDEHTCVDCREEDED